jgi:hypothetical protein
MLVDGVSDLAQPRNDGVVVATDLERVPAPFGSHIDRLELDERDATFRPLAAVMDVPLIQGAILVRHRLFHGPGDEPVSHLHAVDLAGTQEVFECHGALRSGFDSVGPIASTLVQPVKSALMNPFCVNSTMRGEWWRQGTRAAALGLALKRSFH